MSPLDVPLHPVVDVVHVLIQTKVGCTCINIAPTESYWSRTEQDTF